jgi:hypothetical protein
MMGAPFTGQAMTGPGPDGKETKVMELTYTKQ